jgi:Fanconi-associated nuclease 1
MNAWLSDPARYLFVRLFIRKNGYFRHCNISYERDIPDLKAACAELCSFRSFDDRRDCTPDGKEIIVIEDSPVLSQDGFASTSALKVEDAPHVKQDTLGRFALDESHIKARSDVDELCGMLTLDELKVLAKDFKVSPPKSKDFKASSWTRESIVSALKKQTSNQTTLFSSTTSGKGKNKAVWSKQTGKSGQNDVLIKKRSLMTTVSV